MNILFLPSWYESEEEPISGSFFTEQAEALEELGHSVTIALVDIINYPYKCQQKKFRIIHETRHGLDVYRIKVPSFLTGQVPGIFFKYYAHFYLKLYRYMTVTKGLSFDAIYAHSFWHAGYIAGKIKARFGIPVVIQEHRSMLVTGEFRNNINHYLKTSIQNSDAFYCVSEGLFKNVIDRVGYDDKIQILPNMVSPLFRFQPLPENEPFTFVFVGSLTKRKRIMQLLRCFKGFAERHVDTRLYIAGDGPLREEVIETIDSSASLKSHALYVGGLSREGVRDLLGKANVFVLPSSHETFGVVYIEALAVGRPVIGARNGGADNIINESNGVLIDPDHDDQLCEAMETMYSNYELYDAELISKTCLETYSGQRLAETISDKISAVTKRE